MGEEEKQKPVEGKEMEEKKVEEGKNVEEEKPATEEKKGEESPVVPPEIILKVYMHCEGCARKVRRCLKGFQGVEDVMTDCKSNRVVVKGEKADPMKVLERLQRKSHRKVDLLSPIPKSPAPPEETKTEDKENSKPEDKKEEPPAAVLTVVLKVYMHCEACALGIKKRIQRMKGVESAEPDLKSSEVTVKGVFEPPKLVEYIFKRTGKTAVIMKEEIETPKNDGEEKAKDDSKDEKKTEESGGDKDKKVAGGGQEEDNNNKDDKQDGGGDSKEASGSPANDSAPATEETTVAVEVKKNEYYYQPPRYATEFYAYPPQIFSDENPNACSVM